jgi:hypothetical protein
LNPRPLVLYSGPQTTRPAKKYYYYYFPIILWQFVYLVHISFVGLEKFILNKFPYCNFLFILLRVSHLYEGVTGQSDFP